MIDVVYIEASAARSVPKYEAMNAFNMRVVMHTKQPSHSTVEDQSCDLLGFTITSESHTMLGPSKPHL